MWISATLALALCAVISKGYAEEEDPKGKAVVLTSDTFEKETQAGTGMTTGDWFVKFYAPWCGHCRKLEPSWDILARELKGKVNVAKIDCPANSDICKRFEIRGYPTLLQLSGGKFYKFKGPRDLPTMSNFALGGFKELDGTKIPGVEKWWNPLSVEMLMKKGRVLAEVADECTKDLQKMIEKGQKPSDRTIGILTGVLILLSALVMYALFSSSGEEKPSEVSGKKRD